MSFESPSERLFQTTSGPADFPIYFPMAASRTSRVDNEKTMAKVLGCVAR